MPPVEIVVTVSPSIIFSTLSSAPSATFVSAYVPLVTVKSAIFVKSLSTTIAESVTPDKSSSLSDSTTIISVRFAKSETSTEETVPSLTSLTLSGADLSPLNKPAEVSK